MSPARCQVREQQARAHHAAMAVVRHLRHRWPARPEVSVVVEGEQVRTVSRTSADVRGRAIRIRDEAQ